MLDRTSDFINLSRWAAAFVVVTSHLRQIIMADYLSISDPDIITKSFYFITQLGHEAVMVFFVISGYLIGGIAILRYRKSGFDPVDYACHRIARIYTAFLPALLVFGVIDLLGANIFQNTGLYTENLGISSLQRPPIQSMSLPIFIGNGAMLQYGIVTPFGSNGPLWSLAYEWWYYVLFGCGMLAIRRPVIGGILLAILFIFLPFSVLAYGFIWALGAAVALYGASTLTKPPLWLSLPLLLAATLFARITHTAEYDILFSKWRLAIDISVAIAFSGVFLSYHRPGNRIRLNILHKILADFSYSTYLIHFPLMIFLMASLNYIFSISFIRNPGIESAVYYALALIFILCLSWTFSLYTEVKTPRIRRLLVNLSSKCFSDKFKAKYL